MSAVLQADAAPQQQSVSAERTAGLVPWKAGESGNPGGRPVAARTRLTGHFLNSLADDFAREGKAAIAACRLKRPDKYLGVIAAFMPKQIEVTRPLDGLADDELLAIAESLRSQIGAAQNRARDRDAITAESPLDVPSLPEAGDVPRGRAVAPGAAADGRQPGGEDDSRRDGNGDALDGQVSGLVGGAHV